MEEKTLLEIGFKKIKNVHNLPLGSLFELWIEKDRVYLIAQTHIFSETKHVELNINNEQQLSLFVNCFIKQEKREKLKR